MFARASYFTRRWGLLAVALVWLGSASGCALWNKDLWSLDHYRDERATDIDSRLSKGVPMKDTF